MKKQTISEIIGNINSEYIDEANAYIFDKKGIFSQRWKKWTLIAACFVLVAVLAFGIIKGTILSEYVTLENGETVRFAMSKDLAIRAILCSDTRTLSEDEIKEVFGDLPVSGWAIFGVDEDKSIIGFEGYIDDIKLIVSAPGKNVNDVFLEGFSYTTYVNKVPVKAGYFYSGKNVIYFADFKLGEVTVHLVNGGLKNEREKIKLEFATAIYEITSLEKIDLTGIKL